MVSHPLFELRKRSAQSGRYGGGRDPEQSRGLLAVQVEDDPQRDDLALARAQRPEALLELGGEALAERACMLAPFGSLGTLLALPAARVGAKPVERLPEARRVVFLSRDRTGAIS
jgi:hypothetical protein